MWTIHNRFRLETRPVTQECDVIGKAHIFVDMGCSATRL
jgi:hypothetical protein